jgi:hypothetical protein
MIHPVSPLQPYVTFLSWYQFDVVEDVKLVSADV